MNLNRRFIFLFLFLLVAYVSVSAQVDEVKYHLRYNKTTCLYECSMIVTQGSAMSPIDRLQANAQYSFIVPTGSIVSIVTNHNPIQANINYNGTKPLVWEFGSSVISPVSLPGYDIYAVVPTLSPTSFYNNLNTGDTVRLFSVSITPVVKCGSGIRLFDNISDPSSNAPGMNGGDFSNGFSIGSSDPKYGGNTLSVNPAKPAINSLVASCANGLEISLVASTNNCQAPLRYLWSGPDGYSGTTKDVNISNASPFNNGLYHVTVTDNLGCTNTSSIQAYSKPNAGSNQTVSCFSRGTATIAASAGVGVWTVGANSAGTAVIASPNASTTTVAAFSAAGSYALIWSTNTCSDTVIINAGSNCNCNIINSLNIPNEQLFCDFSTDIIIDGNSVTGTAGTYQWIRKLNNQNYSIAPGTSTNEDYQTGVLSPGAYQFRRVFNKTSLPFCKDTSNIIFINVVNKPNAGMDQTLNCITSDTAFMSSSSAGGWSIGQGSAGSAKMSAVSPQKINISKFTVPGQYLILRSNEVCADTAIVTLNDWCGCDFAFAGLDRNKCAGDTIALNSHCIIGMWTPLSSNPMGASLSHLTGGKASIQLSDQAVGDFMFVYTTLNQNRDTVKFTVLAKPVVSLGEDFGFCEGGESAIITANGGNTYLWSTGQTTSSLLISPMATTTYSVTGTDSNGCKSTDAILVTLFEKPDGAIPTIPPVYVNDPLQVNAGNWTNAMGYEWLGPNGFVSASPDNMIPSATTANAGMYILYVSSPDECITISSVMVEVFESPLPVNLGEFKGHWDEDAKSNIITWTTYDEMNNDFFTLERSEDEGRTFFPIYIMDSNIDKEAQNEYLYHDKNIAIGRVYFYRLKQTDFDGRTSYSKTIKIESELKMDVDLSFFPNPTRDKLYIHIESDESTIIDLSIYSMTGSLVYIGKIETGRKHNILLDDFNASNLPSGMYYIQTNVDGIESRNKLMIIK